MRYHGETTEEPKPDDESGGEGSEKQGGDEGSSEGGSEEGSSK